MECFPVKVDRSLICLFGKILIRTQLTLGEYCEIFYSGSRLIVDCRLIKVQRQIYINVRENRMCNQEYTIQRPWQHWAHTTQDEDKQNTI